jgi:WhiB family transcriptional regulator, redox-sensing transcriptional regulator
MAQKVILSVLLLSPDQQKCWKDTLSVPSWGALNTSLSIGTSWRGINPLLSHSLEDHNLMLTTIRNHWNELDWRETATCRDLDPELFFPVGVTGMAIEQIDAAKAFCNTCESKEACLEFAITTNQEYGVWGATTEDERRVLRRVWRAEVRRQRVAS